MKRSAIVTVVAISMTGVASAHLLTPQSQTATPQLSVREKLSPVAPPPVGSSANPENQPASPEVLRKASVNARQPPVPLRVTPRIPVALPTADTSEAYAKGEAGVRTTSKSNPTDAKSDESAARAAIEADGYKGVEVLHKGDNGLWHARALRGGTEILLTVDAKGAVTTAN